MERTAPPDKAKGYLEEYSIKLGENLRGVMVIKSKDKTRASQRKGALSNWNVHPKQFQAVIHCLDTLETTSLCINNLKDLQASTDC